MTIKENTIHLLKANRLCFHYKCQTINYPLLKILILLIFSSCDNEPYNGPISFEPSLTCQQASQIVYNAENEFLNSDITNYDENCLTYLSALQLQLESCPENTTEIQALIDSLNGCSSDSFFKVDFDNETYFALFAEAHIGNGQLTITGERGNEKFELILFETTEGNYELGITNNDGDTNTATYFPDVTTTESWVSFTNGIESQGQINISQIDFQNGKISGTFNFTGFNINGANSFTNGVFTNIRLSKENEFFALVDGVEFNDSYFITYHNEGINAGFVVGNPDTTAVMDFTIADNMLPGTYSLGMIPNYPRAGYTSNPDFYYHGQGSLTIIAHNPQTGFLMGTFEFIAEFIGASPESYTITEGSFCINYFN